MNIEVRMLRQNELDYFVEVIVLFNQVFEMDGATPQDTTYLQTVLKTPGFLVFAALSEEKMLVD